MSTSFFFDSSRICIGDFCISRNTGLKAFVYLLEAVGIPCTTPEEDTVCVDHVTLFHNLRGKCHFRFSQGKSGSPVFSKVKFVIDPDLYPGLKDVPRAKRMQELKNFVAISLRDRLDAASDSRPRGFEKKEESIYESTQVRVRQDMDPYHAVITVSYLERLPEEKGASAPDPAELLARIDALEERIGEVEKENRELRKANDVILSIFSGLKPAHDLLGAQIPEDSADPETKDPGKKDVSPMTPERRSALISRYTP